MQYLHGSIGILVVGSIGILVVGHKGIIVDKYKFYKHLYNSYSENN